MEGAAATAGEGGRLRRRRRRDEPAPGLLPSPPPPAPARGETRPGRRRLRDAVERCAGDADRRSTMTPKSPYGAPYGSPDHDDDPFAVLDGKKPKARRRTSPDRRLTLAVVAAAVVLVAAVAILTLAAPAALSRMRSGLRRPRGDEATGGPQSPPGRDDAPSPYQRREPCRVVSCALSSTFSVPLTDECCGAARSFFGFDATGGGGGRGRWGGGPPRASEPLCRGRCREDVAALLADPGDLDEVCRGFDDARDGGNSNGNDDDDDEGGGRDRSEVCPSFAPCEVLGDGKLVHRECCRDLTDFAHSEQGEGAAEFVLDHACGGSCLSEAARRWDAGLVRDLFGRCVSAATKAKVVAHVEYDDAGSGYWATCASGDREEGAPELYRKPEAVEGHSVEMDRWCCESLAGYVAASPVGSDDDVHGAYDNDNIFDDGDGNHNHNEALAFLAEGGNGSRLCRGSCLVRATKALDVAGLAGSLVRDCARARPEMGVDPDDFFE